MKTAKISVSKLILYFILFFLFFVLLSGIYMRKITTLILIGLTIYSVIVHKNNKILFLFFLVIAYFNISVILTKYSFFENSNILNIIYSQLYHESSMDISLLCVTIFMNIILLMIERDKKKVVNIDFSYAKNKKNTKYIVMAILIGQILILIRYILSNVGYVDQLYEYYIIFSIIGLYLSKKEKVLSKILQFFVLLSCFLTLAKGARITALEQLIAVYVICYSNKVNNKQLLLSLTLGVAAFTIIGIYGDLKYSTTVGLEKFNLDFIFYSISERKFSLDTSISSYWTGVSMIDNMFRYDIGFRIQNFIQFFSKYLILGSKSGYIDPPSYALKFQTNYGGGFLTSYFYFWLKSIGVIIISLYVGFFTKQNYSKKLEDSDFFKLLIAFFISTLPRWYLYTPTMLFRGLFFFIVVYIIVFKMFLSKEKIR